MRRVVLEIPAGRPFLKVVRRWFVHWPRFIGQFIRFRQASRASGRELGVRWRDLFPRLDDATSSTPFDRHYIYHTAWAARVLARTRPQRHVDISSSLYFSAVASGFVTMEVYDFRPPRLVLENVKVGAADLGRLAFQSNTIESLSCMHVAEHVGLGRYGDPLDPVGDLTAMRELQRVMAPGGRLLFVVPVGSPRVMFNAHRIYAYDQVLQAFDQCDLEEFALIPDAGEESGLVYGASPQRVDGQRYACGCFLFRKQIGSVDRRAPES